MVHAPVQPPRGCLAAPSLAALGHRGSCSSTISQAAPNLVTEVLIREQILGAPGERSDPRCGEEHSAWQSSQRARQLMQGCRKALSVHVKE